MAYKVKSKMRSYVFSKPYTESQLASVGRIEGLSFRQSLIFAKFMKQRFPKENHLPYIKEWAFRFAEGNPESYMDSSSKEVYKKIK